MAISKVVYKSSPSATPVTWMDTTQKTVTSGSMLNGTTALKNDGTDITGSIATKTSSDLTASGDTITAPAGYYASSASKSVASGTAGTPTATKGTVSSNSISVTPSVTNTAGYISGGTINGTAVTVSASELVSGTKSITSSGNTDVTNYATASVASGTVTAPSTISGTSATVTAGTNTITLSKTVSVTPTVSTAGYVSSGTAGDSAVSLTASVNTRSSSDLTASGATVTAPAGYYANSASKSVASGSATAPASISGTSATVSTGTNTLTLSKTVSVTPSVTAGYVSSGTAGDSSVSLTASVNTRSSSDLTASNLTVTAPSGYYASDATKTLSDQNLVAGNIKKDVEIFGVTGSYEGGGGTTWETLYTNPTRSIEDWGDDPYYYLPVYDYFDTNSDFALGDIYRITWNNTQYICEIQEQVNPFGAGARYCVGNATIAGGTTGDNEPFCGVGWGVNLIFITFETFGTFALTIEKQVSGGGGSTLITKTITENGTYDAEDDDADGYSSVTVSLPSGTAGTPTATKGSVSNHSISVTPSVTNTAGVISGGTINGTAVTVSASELVSGSETKTANGTYDVTNLASLVVNVSGGSGLEYETGTYTPSTNTAQPTISFANSHSRPPVFVCISDTSAASGITSNSNTSWSIIDYYRINGAGFPYSTSATRYGLVTYSYRGSNNTTVSTTQIQYSSDDTGTSSNSYYRYWATASAFKPSSTSTSRYWRNGRTYKWIAVWK